MINSSCINDGKDDPMQAQHMMPQDINVDDVLKGMSMVEGAQEYLVLNSEGIIVDKTGIPIKKSPSITA